MTVTWVDLPAGPDFISHAQVGLITADLAKVIGYFEVDSDTPSNVLASFPTGYTPTDFKKVIVAQEDFYPHPIISVTGDGSAGTDGELLLNFDIFPGNIGKKIYVDFTYSPA